jgi:hypothetical protein
MDWPSADRSLLPTRGSSPTMTEIFDSDGLPFSENPLDMASAETPNAPPAPTKKQAKGKGKGPHKRQISEAIPRAEREVERAPVTAQVTTQAETRKSARSRKPKSRE